MAVTQKRPLDDTVFSTKHIVMDIEGTTTSISFVKDKLFPYVRQHLDGYLSSHWNEDEFKSVVTLLKDQAAEDKKADLEGAIEIPSDGSDDDVKAAIAKSVLWQMDGDRKTTALKKLQGHMWRQGYKNGDLKGHLFADVAPALRDWVKDGKKLYVYSSGSVEAQKLLFGNSSAGDLTELFTDFFDTEVGAKVDAESYKSIVKKLDCSADDVLFLTDLPKEASAAREAGLPVILVEREGNEPIANELRKEFSAVSSFQDLSFESSCKKPKVTQEKCEDVKSNEETSMEVSAKSEKKADPSVPEAEAMDVDKQAEVEVSPKASTDPEEKKENVEDKISEVKVPEKTSTPEAETMDTDVSEKVTEEAAKVEDGGKVETSAIDAKPDEIKSEEKPVVDEQEAELKNVIEKTDEQVTQPKTDKEKDSEINKSENEVVAVKEDLKMDTDEKLEAVVKEPVTESKTDSDGKDEVKSESDKQPIAPAVEEKKESTDEKIKVDKVEEKAAETVEGVAETEVLKEPRETDEHKSEEKTEKKTVPEEVKEKSESEVTNGVEKIEEKTEKLNGSTNGTTNGTSNGASHEEKKSDENGAVENGHEKVEEDGIPEIIVAKTAPQIEGGKADAGVVSEA